MSDGRGGRRVRHVRPVGRAGLGFVRQITGQRGGRLGEERICVAFCRPQVLQGTLQSAYFRKVADCQLGQLAAAAGGEPHADQAPVGLVGTGLHEPGRDRPFDELRRRCGGGRTAVERRR